MVPLRACQPPFYAVVHDENLSKTGVHNLLSFHVWSSSRARGINSNSGASFGGEEEVGALHEKLTFTMWEDTISRPSSKPGT